MDIAVQARSIKEIKLNPRNAKTHSGKQIREIANSIVASRIGLKRCWRPKALGSGHRCAPGIVIWKACGQATGG